MREQIRSFLANGTNRRALLSAGAYIAGAYFGAAFPGGLEAIHEAFQYAVATSPFSDPVAQISALFDGALHQTAAALHSLGEWCQSVGVELSQRVRERIEEARTLLGPALDQAKELFVETWRPASEAAAMLRDQIRNAVPSQEAAISWCKEVGKTAVNLVRTAVEVYGVYEAAKALYGKVFSRAKTELREKVVTAPEETPEVTERSINLNLNASVGGGPVIDAALRDREVRIAQGVDPTAGVSALGSDQIIWVSDKLKGRVSSGLDGLIADVSDAPVRVNLASPDPTRLEDPVDPVADLSHRDRFPTINWDQSPLSEDRLSRMRCGSRATGPDPEDLKDIRIVLAEDGTLKAERTQARAPDLLMSTSPP